VWLVLLATGYEIVRAKGHEAFTLSGGTLTYYRSSWDNVYCLQAGQGQPSTSRSLAAGAAGRTLWQLSFAAASDLQNQPDYLSSGLALNATASVPLSEGFFSPFRRDVWRYRLPLWSPDHPPPFSAPLEREVPPCH
jgi:hypothetical protein